MKLKKDVKPQITKLPVLKIKYNIVVPFMGLADALTMMSFFFNDVTDGNLFMKGFFAFFAAVGLGFTYWGLMWKITADGKQIRVRPAFGRSRTMDMGELKRVTVHKKEKSGSLIYYELIRNDDTGFVKVYPLMRESSALLERMKRLGIPVTETRER